MGLNETVICPVCKHKVEAYRPFGMAAKYVMPHRVKGDQCIGSYRRDDEGSVDLAESAGDKAKREAASKQYNEDMRGEE